jgi:hypothetical protein
MSDEILENITYDKLKKIQEELFKEDEKKYLPRVVFVSNSIFERMNYLSAKYPKGALRISKIDKKSLKKQSLKNKRYFVSEYIYPMPKIKICKNEALIVNGIAVMPFLHMGVCDEQ